MTNKMLFGLWFCMITLAFQTAIAQAETPVSEKEVEKLKATEEDLWYTDLPLPEEQKPSAPQKATKIPAWVGLAFKFMTWAVIAAILGYILYIIIQQVRLNKSAISEVIDDDIEIESAEILNRIDFQESVRRAIEKENYRLAIRFYYLWTIQQLNDGGLITFRKDKTNQAYVRELTQNNGVSPEVLIGFKTCTRLYEYVWFGNFDVDKSRFEEIEPQFSFILNRGEIA